MSDANRVMKALPTYGIMALHPARAGLQTHVPNCIDFGVSHLTADVTILRPLRSGS